MAASAGAAALTPGARVSMCALPAQGEAPRVPRAA
jgi:hypothetical protein